MNESCNTYNETLTNVIINIYIYDYLCINTYIFCYEQSSNEKPFRNINYKELNKIVLK